MKKKFPLVKVNKKQISRGFLSVKIWEIFGQRDETLFRSDLDRLEHLIAEESKFS